MSNIVCTAIMPHPPVIVPIVGDGREVEAAATCRACETVAQRIVTSQPDLLIVISPHSPMHGVRSVTIRTAPRHVISFRDFGVADDAGELPNLTSTDPEAFERVLASYPRFVAHAAAELDHGAGVPLSFIYAAGWRGPTLVLGPDYQSRDRSLVTASALAGVFAKRETAIAVVASADLSHALRPDAPAGYEPDGACFDDAFVAAIRDRRYGRLAEIDRDVAANARQDALETTLMALRMSNSADDGAEFLGYEAPFGVGYLCAVLNRRVGHDAL